MIENAFHFVPPSEGRQLNWVHGRAICQYLAALEMELPAQSDRNSQHTKPEEEEDFMDTSFIGGHGHLIGLIERSQADSRSSGSRNSKPRKLS